MIQYYLTEKVIEIYVKSIKDYLRGKTSLEQVGGASRHLAPSSLVQYLNQISIYLTSNF